MIWTPYLVLISSQKDSENSRLCLDKTKIFWSWGEPFHCLGSKCIDLALCSRKQTFCNNFGLVHCIYICLILQSYCWYYFYTRRIIVQFLVLSGCYVSPQSIVAVIIGDLCVWSVAWMRNELVWCGSIVCASRMRWVHGVLWIGVNRQVCVWIRLFECVLE